LTYGKTDDFASLSLLLWICGSLHCFISHKFDFQISFRNKKRAVGNNSGVLFFLVVTLLFLRFINKYVYVSLVDDKEIVFKSILLNGQVSIKDVRDIRRVWFNTYRFRILNRKYYMTAFAQDLAYLQNLIDH
jgi:hypothetical protein